MFRFKLFFARRYLFSKKSHSVINIISGVSAFSVAIPVMAMVILLSVFNGFEGVIEDMYKSFDPDIKITPAQGKVFDTANLPYEKLKSLDQIEELSYVLDDDVLFEYKGYRSAGAILGVDSLYTAVIPIGSLISSGEYSLAHGEIPEAVVGQGVAYTLGIRKNSGDALIIHSPKRENFSSLLPNVNQSRVFPSGVFQLDGETDSKYVIVSLDFAQQMLDKQGKVSSISVKLKVGVPVTQAQQAIAAVAGDSFKIESRYQQNEQFYRIMMYERWGIFFIILLVLIVASFSIIGSLVMLIIDKEKDIRTLITMGADTKTLRGIFTAEGMLIYCAGAVMGLILGLLLAFAQQYFGLVSINSQTMLVDAFPVKVKFVDILLITLTFMLLSYVISALTVKAMVSSDKMRIS